MNDATELPLDDIRTVLAKIRGDASVSFKAAALAALRVITWAVDSFTPETGPHPVFGTVGGAVAADRLEDALGPLVDDGVRGAPDAGAIPWAVIIPLLFQFVQAWLSRRNA
jgi:hypothetical protein